MTTPTVWRRWLNAAVAFATAALWLAAGPAVARPFKDMVGLQVKYAQGQPLGMLEQLPELGVSWVRDHVGWATIEPVAGQYHEFPDDVKTRLQFYKRHRIGVVFVLGLTNKRAYPPTAAQPTRHADPQAFARHAVAVAGMLKAAGVDFVLEVWNEPHGKGSELFDLFGGQWNGAPPSPWLDHYLKIVRETVAQVKRFDRSIRVLSNDDMWVLHYWFLEGGLPPQLDGFAIHPYTNSGPETIAVAADVDWLRPFSIVDADRSFGSAVQRLVRRGKQKLGRTPEVWITEWGWRVGGPQERGGVFTEAQVAAYLPRAFVLAAAAGVQTLCWFSSQDTVDGQMGLVANDGRKRPAYTAFRGMVAALGPLEYAHQLIGAKDRTRGLQAHVFKGVRSHKIVLWSTDERERRVRLDDSLQLQDAVDALGQRVPMAFPWGEAVEITVGQVPVYVTVRSLPGVRSGAVTVQDKAP